MFFILPCPTCGKKLRFPLDRGKIRVTCTCGASFIADPDDTELYKKGAFDVAGKRPGTSLYQKISESFKTFSFRNLTDRTIRHLIDIRYRLQNFRLLPAGEQKKILIRLILVVMVITLLLFFYLSARRTVPVDNGII